MKTVHRHNDTNLQQKVTLNFDKFHTSSWKLNGLDIGVAVSWCCYCCRCPMSWAVKIWISWCCCCWYYICMCCLMSCQNLDLSLQLLPLQTLSSKFIQFSIYFMWHVLLNGLLNVTCHDECLNVLFNVVEIWCVQYSLLKCSTSTVITSVDLHE